MPSISRVILWSDEGVHDISHALDDLTGFTVYGLNDDDEMVGTMWGPQQPFHWHDGKLRNLNDHIPASLSLDLWDATGINASGQIIAHGQFIGTGDFSNYTFILTPDVAPIPGDVDGDGAVNINDLLSVISAWGPCPSPPAQCVADVNSDGFVNIADLLIVINNWT